MGNYNHKWAKDEILKLRKFLRNNNNLSLHAMIKNAYNQELIPNVSFSALYSTAWYVQTGIDGENIVNHLVSTKKFLSWSEKELNEAANIILYYLQPESSSLSKAHQAISMGLLPNRTIFEVVEVIEAGRYVPRLTMVK